MQKRSALFKQLARADLLVLDDFGLAPLSDQTVRDLLAILDDRYDRASTLITSQLPLDQWHAYLGDRTVADAILDRLVQDMKRLGAVGEEEIIDETFVLDDSSHPAQHRPGINRNGGRACSGMLDRHDRNTQLATIEWG